MSLENQAVQWVLNLAAKKGQPERLTMINNVRQPDEEFIMIDSGASRATCPPTHAPGVPTSASEAPVDIRLADNRPVRYFGEKSVRYRMPEGGSVERMEMEIDWQVAGVSHSSLSVSEACDGGHSVLFSPHGSYLVPVPLDLPSGTPNVPLVRHDNLYWMRSQTISAATRGGSVSPPPSTAVHGLPAGDTAGTAWPAEEALPERKTPRPAAESQAPGRPDTATTRSAHSSPPSIDAAIPNAYG